jgi:hypothetical protein
MFITPGWNVCAARHVWGIVFLAFAISLGCSRATKDAPPPAPNMDDPGALKPGQAGLVVNDVKAHPGYTLLAPITSTETHLLNMEGHVVHTWKSDCEPALGACLLENGHLFRAGQLPKDQRPYTHSGGGGRIQEFTWEGTLVWDFKYVDDRCLPHHDVLKLPNGNVLMVVCERMTAAEVIALGRNPHSVSEGYLMGDTVVEVKPTGKTTGEVVWVWRIWDHLVQEYDPGKPNHAKVSEHPELIDLNCRGAGTATPIAQGAALDKLRGLGYVGGATSTSNSGVQQGDWTHTNSIAYNSDLDQIVLTSLGFQEFWIIDHSTTKTEAASHTGGKCGKGGDLLYRWGNPANYRSNSPSRLYAPHNAHWIAKGLPGEGHMLVFNNGGGRIGSEYSSVEEIVLPLKKDGTYDRVTGKAFGPSAPTWSCAGNGSTKFFSPTFSGAQRLPNGNTFICVGLGGTLLEVTPRGEVVWKFVHSDMPPPPPGVPLPPELLATLGTPVFRSERYGYDYPGVIELEQKAEVATE